MRPRRLFRKLLWTQGTDTSPTDSAVTSGMCLKGCSNCQGPRGTKCSPRRRGTFPGSQHTAHHLGTGSSGHRVPGKVLRRPRERPGSDGPQQPAPSGRGPLFHAVSEASSMMPQSLLTGSQRPARTLLPSPVNLPRS